MSLNEILTPKVKQAQRNGVVDDKLLALFREIVNRAFKRRWPFGLKNKQLEHQIKLKAIDQLKRSVMQFKFEKSDAIYAYLMTCALGALIHQLAKSKPSSREIKKRDIWS